MKSLLYIVLLLSMPLETRLPERTSEGLSDQGACEFIGAVWL